jgi:hypothetical protein
MELGLKLREWVKQNGGITEHRLDCQYCGKQARLIGGEALFPDKAIYHKKRFWYCKPCDAWVGCHPKSTKPLGTLANKKLRLFRIKTHERFDKLWKTELMSRDEAYSLLRRALNVSEEEGHIGMFGEDQCQKAMCMVNQFYQAVRVTTELFIKERS